MLLVMSSRDSRVRIVTNSHWSPYSQSPQVLLSYGNEATPTLVSHVSPRISWATPSGGFSPVWDKILGPPPKTQKIRKPDIHYYDSMKNDYHNEINSHIIKSLNKLREIQDGNQRECLYLAMFSSELFPPARNSPAARTEAGLESCRVWSKQLYATSCLETPRSCKVIEHPNRRLWGVFPDL